MDNTHNDIVFKRLEAEDVEQLLPYFFLRSNLSCDSTIFDSYLWRDFYQVEYAIVEDRILLMKMQEEGEDSGAIPLCRPEDLEEGFRILEDYFHRVLGKPLRLYGVDEQGLKLLNPDPERYRIREQKDQADYIYDAEKLRTLSGSKYHKKKNNVNAFRKAYEGRWEYRKLTAASACEIWEFLERWRGDKESDAEEHLSAEICGLKNYLSHMQYFQASMAGIYIDGRLEAFTIGTYNPLDRMSVVHVEKANGEIRGLYTLINQEFQIHEFPDALLVNREDDVGLPSLRKAKQSYHPIQMCRKFDILPGKDDSRRLWEEIFSEDSQEFLDYYDQWKRKDHRMAMRYRDGRAVSMVHWNPYRIRCGETLWNSSYIVAVATRPEYRHQGLMAGLLREGLASHYMERIPLVFLMPADPAIYQPFGFRYIYEKNVLTWEMCVLQDPDADLPEIRPLAGRELEAAAAFAEEVLGRRFRVYAARNRAYMLRTHEECRSEGGAVEGIFRDGTLVGILDWWGQEDGSVDIRELILDERYRCGCRQNREAAESENVELENAESENAEASLLEPMLRRRWPNAREITAVTIGEGGQKKPIIMARIVNLKEFLRVFTAEAPCQICIRVEDPILPGNRGTFLWKCGPQGSELTETEGKPQIRTGVEELMTWLSGMDVTGAWEAMEMTPEGEAFAAAVQPWEGVFLPEIV